MRFALLTLALALYAAPPTITELQPRGAQKGRPFELTIVGKDLADGPQIESALPANFTPLNASKPGTVTYLVEPTKEWSVGTYPIRVKSIHGISNILLFNVGNFPEMVEEESRPGSLPHQNDSIEKAQSLPGSSITVNGRLIGPERDVYRIPVKAGERRVFEVEARRAGSALDPVIQVYDSSGKRIARSEDDPLLSLDPRLELTFAKEGVIYVELFDARYSSQMQDFYRFKTGTYAYATEVFPLGGRRNEPVQVSLGKSTVQALNQTFINLPEANTLPLRFALGDDPELREPITSPITLPVTINGRLDKPGEVDSYSLDVTPGESLMFELEARELGTSKLTGLITISDESGKKLASAGDGPLPVDVAAVQVSSRTLGDPILLFDVPEGVQKLKIHVEDLAQRGGAHYAYRLNLRRAAHDIKPTITTPYLNIPAGGTAIVLVDVERRGYMGPLKVSPIGLPQGITVAGGDVAAEIPDPLIKFMNRRATLSLTARKDLKLPPTELRFEATGQGIQREAVGLGYLIAVNGATSQGVVDRQRALNGRYLGYRLPTSLTDPLPASLELELIQSDKKEAGIEYRFRWRFKSNAGMMNFPDTVDVTLPNLGGTRIIEMEVDKKDRSTGTFLVTTSKNSLPGPYNIGVSGRLPGNLDIVSPLLRLDIPELETKSDATSSAR